MEARREGLIMTARKAKVVEAKTGTPVIAAAPEPEIIIAGPENEPRYEAVQPTARHKIAEDPETHIKYCTACHAPEWMIAAGLSCDPREVA